MSKQTQDPRALDAYSRFVIAEGELTQMADDVHVWAANLPTLSAAFVAESLRSASLVTGKVPQEPSVFPEAMCVAEREDIYRRVAPVARKARYLLKQAEMAGVS